MIKIDESKVIKSEPVKVKEAGGLEFIIIPIAFFIYALIQGLR